MQLTIASVSSLHLCLSLQINHLYLYCSHLPSDHGLGPVLWVCPCKAGVGQGLDWGPPIGAIGMPVVHKAIFMSVENDLLMILNTSDNYHQINHLHSNKYHTNRMIPVRDTNINTSMAMYYHAFLPILNFLITKMCEILQLYMTKKTVSIKTSLRAKKYLDLQSLNAELT